MHLSKVLTESLKNIRSMRSRGRQVMMHSSSFFFFDLVSSESIGTNLAGLRTQQRYQVLLERFLPREYHYIRLSDTAQKLQMRTQDE
jgi:hypothetical protein